MLSNPQVLEQSLFLLLSEWRRKRKTRTRTRPLPGEEEDWRWALSWA